MDSGSYEVITSSTSHTFLLPVTRTHTISILTVNFPSCSHIPMVHAPSNSGISPLFVAAPYGVVYGMSVSENMYRVIRNIVWGLTTCHTQYTSDRSVRVFLFNRTTLQVFVTYLTGALYVHPL